MALRPLLPATMSSDLVHLTGGHEEARSETAFASVDGAVEDLSGSL